MLVFTLFIFTSFIFSNALPLGQVLPSRGMPDRRQIASPNATIAPSSIDSSSVGTSNNSSSAQKYVVAHHMVGNTFPYTVADWLNDITLAHSFGIDGFALNVGSDSWQPQRVADAYVFLPSLGVYTNNIISYTAAEQSGTDFKLFISFDMSYVPLSLTSLDHSAIVHQLPSLQHPRGCTAPSHIYCDIRKPPQPINVQRSLLRLYFRWGIL
jgi:hypothetical protein